MAQGPDSKFLIGLFVTIGVILAIGGLIWLGAKDIFASGKMYVSYFDTAVDTISAGSTVKFQGVEIGTVKKIDIAPDDKLVGVIMKIRRPGIVRKDTVATVKTAGFTGVGFVNLEPHIPGEKELSRDQLSFKPKYTVIPSTSSGMGQLISQVQSIISDIKSIDFRGISSEIKGTAKAAHDIVAGEKVRAIVANTKGMTASLQTAASKIDEVTAKPAFARIPEDAQNTIAETRKMIVDVSQKVDSLKLEEIGRNVNSLTGDLDKRSKTITAEMERLSENLRQASETLDMLLERLYASPSDILFSKPAASNEEVK